MKKALKASLSFFKLDGEVQKEAFRIMILYLKVSCLIRCYPLRRYYNKYFLHDNEKPFDFAAYRNDLSLIKKVIKYMPGKPTCLKESIIVHLYFRRKGLKVPLYLGVSTKDEFMAHAWYEKNSSKGYNQVKAE